MASLLLRGSKGPQSSLSLLCHHPTRKWEGMEVQTSHMVSICTAKGSCMTRGDESPRSLLPPSDTSPAVAWGHLFMALREGNLSSHLVFAGMGANGVIGFSLDFGWTKVIITPRWAGHGGEI